MKFSIITVCYNSELTIERTIHSVLNQTFQDFEYIIVDGKSTDRTLEIINKYKDQFKNITIISEKDSGIYDAMNKGISVASGEIIGIINSDDWLDKNALLSVNTAYTNNKCADNCLYCGWMNFYYDKNNFQTLKTSRLKLESLSKLYRVGGIHHPSTFVPKNIYNTISTYDVSMKIVADTDFILRCYYKGVGFYLIDDVIANMSSNGISNVSNFGCLKKFYNDRKKILAKYNLSLLRYYYLLLYSLTLHLVKLFIPESFMKRYRR